MNTPKSEQAAERTSPPSADHQPNAEPGARDSALSVAFAGGGSGGHLIPSLAIAEQLLSLVPSARFVFLTSQRSIDRTILDNNQLADAGSSQAKPPLQIALPIESGVVLKSSPLRYLTGFWKSVRQAHRTLRERHVDVVVGTGGFASIPTVLAAWWLKIPVVLLETNAVAGRANRRLARFADRILTGLPMQDTKWQRSVPTESIGVPIRQSDTADAGSVTDSQQTPTLLIMGGSQGAARLNSLIIEALGRHPLVPSDWQVVHQTGEADFDQVSMAWDASGARCEVVRFIQNVPAELARASLVISRAGAISLAEIQAAAVPAVLVPKLDSADQHQLHNALAYAQTAVARVLGRPEDQTADQLHQMLQQLITEASGQPDTRLDSVAVSAARQAASVICEVVGIRRGSTDTGANAR